MVRDSRRLYHSNHSGEHGFAQKKGYARISGCHGDDQALESHQPTEIGA